MRSIQKAFARRPWLKIGSLAVVSLLLIASLFWVWTSFSTPTDTEEQVALVNYNHNGKFDYAVYVGPSHLLGPPPAEAPQDTEEEERAVYFLNIIDDIDIDFTYEFITDTSVTEISSDVAIVAIIEGPSGWQKEILILRTTREGNRFSIPFEVDLVGFREEVHSIEEELGFRKPTEERQDPYGLVFEARVHVAANTGAGWIRDSFVQPMEVWVGRDTLAWDKELFQSERKFIDRFNYKQQGNFHYTITLKENSLYGASTLSAGTYEPPPVTSRPPGEVYFPRIIDIMQANFGYDFAADRPVSNLVEEVEVTAILEYPEMWSKTFTLIPKTQMSGEFTVYFPVDINYFNELNSTIRQEIGVGAASQNLTIKAEVHTTANTEAGRIDEVFTHTLSGMLGQGILTWSGKLVKSQTGTITETITVHDPNVFGLRILSLGITALVLLGFLFVTWNATHARLAMSWIEEEAFRAKKKYKKVIVDITELPPVKGGLEVVIPISSVDELVKVADGLLKPVLHQAMADKHIYCVIDGLTRYEYVSEIASLQKQSEFKRLISQ